MTLTPGEIASMALALLSLAALLWLNRHLFQPGRVSGVTRMELVYCAIGLPGALLGYYYNFQYFAAYGGEAGWAHFTRLLFANPAAASVSTDLSVAALLFLPIWPVVDGRRSGMRATWLYFPLGLLISVSFAMGIYLALRERQLRWNQ